MVLPGVAADAAHGEGGVTNVEFTVFEVGAPVGIKVDVGGEGGLFVEDEAEVLFEKGGHGWGLWVIGLGAGGVCNRLMVLAGFLLSPCDGFAAPTPTLPHGEGVYLFLLFGGKPRLAVLGFRAR